MTRFIRFSAIATALLSFGFATPAQALASKAWVSSHGVDAAGCGAATSPCRTFQYVHDSIIGYAGEIDVMDSGGYGALTITKWITIVNSGSLATVSSIIINAGTQDRISLEGLTLDGFGAADGIKLNSDSSLEIIGCRVRNYIRGITIFSSATSVSVSIVNTIVSGNVSGITFIASPPGINATINQSMIRDNGTGVTGSPYGSLLVSDSVISANGIGLESHSGTARLRRSVVTGNSTGVLAVNGAVSSYGDNSVYANGVNVNGALAAIASQ